MPLWLSSQIPRTVLIMRRCQLAQQGKCPFVHDPKTVAVCAGWLQGSCTSDRCPLQHSRCPDLMPTCTHFLRGACSNADCPYLHINLCPEAPVCQEFLSGYCPSGAACARKHFTPRMVKLMNKNGRGAASAGGASRLNRAIKVE